MAKALTAITPSLGGGGPKTEPMYASKRKINIDQSVHCPARSFARVTVK
jgi:hypothetical protein